VLFLPGMGWTAESGWPFLELRDRYALHMLDLPGLGRSAPMGLDVGWADMARWVKSYCDDRSLETIRIIGHSVGGVMALAFADVFPERVHQLVLLDAGYQKVPLFPEEVAKPLRYFTPLLSAWAQAGGAKAVGRLSRRADGGPPQGEEAVERALQNFARQQGLPITADLRTAFLAGVREVHLTDGAVSMLLAIYRSKPVSAFCRLKPATLLIVPESAERRYPLTSIDELNLPVLLYEVSGGHYVHFVHPEVAGTVRDFFDHWS
jgi:pimeloyl-ACP methyl ester carboxylesterase